MGLELIYGIGAVVLGLAIAWGAVSYITRNKAKDAMSERATRRVYQERTPDDAAEPPSPETLPKPR